MANNHTGRGPRLDLVLPGARRFYFNRERQFKLPVAVLPIRETEPQRLRFVNDARQIANKESHEEFHIC